MRTLLLLLSLLTFSAHATPRSADPRNTSQYQVLFDISANGDSDLVKGFGGYIQVYANGSLFAFRFCTNFEGKGLEGRPNLNRERMKLVRYGTEDSTAYRCKDYTPAEVVEGVPLVQLGNKSFFGMRTERWSTSEGGEIIFKFARKIPLVGSPTYRALRIRATRTSGELTYVVETIIPRGDTFETHFLHFGVSTSGLGLPNGIHAVTANPGERSERRIDIDGLETAGKGSSLELD